MHEVNLILKNCWTNAIANPLHVKVQQRRGCGALGSQCVVNCCHVFFCHVFFCALVARCAEDESVAAQDVGGTRNVKHHGQQKEQMYHFDMFR